MPEYIYFSILCFNNKSSLMINSHSLSLILLNVKLLPCIWNKTKTYQWSPYSESFTHFNAPLYATWNHRWLSEEYNTICTIWLDFLSTGQNQISSRRLKYRSSFSFFYTWHRLLEETFNISYFVAKLI